MYFLKNSVLVCIINNQMFGLHLKYNDLASLFQAVCTSCTIYMVFCVNQIEHANVFIHIMTITFILYETFVKLLNLLNSYGLLFYLNYGESSQEERHCRVWENPLDGRNFLSLSVFISGYCLRKTIIFQKHIHTGIDMMS